MIDLIECASFAEMHYREDEGQVDAMQRNPRFPVEEVIRRRSSLPMRANIVRIVRIVADDARIRELVEQQLSAKGGA